MRRIEMPSGPAREGAGAIMCSCCPWPRARAGAASDRSTAMRTADNRLMDQDRESGEHLGARVGEKEERHAHRAFGTGGGGAGHVPEQRLARDRPRGREGGRIEREPRLAAARDGRDLVAVGCIHAHFDAERVAWEERDVERQLTEALIEEAYGGDVRRVARPGPWGGAPPPGRPPPPRPPSSPAAARSATPVRRRAPAARGAGRSNGQRGYRPSRRDA